MTKPVLYLTESDVSELVDLNDAVDALEVGLRLEGLGATLSLPKALGVFGDSNIHSLGSTFLEDGWAGFKNWINNPRGAGGKYVLFDTHNASVTAVIDIGMLGSLRTAAISGVATRVMAALDADELALVGTGRQALMQLAAVAVVRPLKRVKVFSPTPENRRAFVERASAQFPFVIEESETVEAALSDCPIVTLVSRATTPFVTAAMIAEGAHVNAVGAVLPKNAEINDDVFGRASLVVVDSLPDVKRVSREFIDHYDGKAESWESVRTLSSLLAEGFQHRPDKGITLFKAIGMGLSDLCVAKLIVERARLTGLGMSLPPSGRLLPRWRILKSF